ncbi:Conserved_hypothetical protein [Hexamita inflata]|uniref:Glycoside hydrolase family 5 domain-containing protein n=1 Tax=Hexamita inflata TaxID=28002 RepID=A0AA86NIL7_9EUKA|nr:Conserved hypothetical protein [Hexamita inflata]CAI9919956.1 Conserved hypothetical protein [Hexamita inflata]CAI9971969.1 Conserved hypothetical protein [Hexamita inflata]
MLTFFNIINYVTIDPLTNNYVTEDKKQIIFHGVNAVKKEFPYIPDIYAKKQDYNTTFIKKDIDFLKAHGFNLVRLGVMWPGVYPEQNQINMTYLDEMTKLVNLLGEQGIHTQIEMHQDLLTAFTCGEGLPMWAVPYQREGIKNFPLPKYAEYARNPDTHYIDRSLCFQHAFSNYYDSDSVGNMIECLFAADCNPFQSYTDTTAKPQKTLILREEMIKFWVAVANHFKVNQFVIGYDLINEPYAGNKNEHFDLWKNTTKFDETILTPFYQSIMDAIWKVDKNHIIFFEPTILAMAKPPGFHKNGPGFEIGIPSTSQSYAWHLYCMTVDSEGEPQIPKQLCSVVDNLWFEKRVKNQRELNLNGIVNEFGAVPNTDKFWPTLRHEIQLFGKEGMSWAYWAFKPFGDITTTFNEAKGLNEGLFNPNMTVQKEKVKILSHPYVQICAGELSVNEFDFAKGTLTIKMKAGQIGEYSEVVVGSLWNGFGRGGKIIQGNTHIQRVDGKVLLHNIVEGEQVEIQLW